MAKIHNVFYMSLLQKSNIDPFMLLAQVLIEVKGDLTLEMRSIKILDQSKKEL
jgi:hypothetical protein